MSAAASVVIAVVLLARLALRKAPKKWSYLLWSAVAFRLCCPVAFRLCCPVSFRGAFSIFRLKPLQSVASAVASDSVTRPVGAITFIPRPVTPVAPVSPVNPTLPGDECG